MSTATAERRPDFDLELRQRALATYRETHSYRRAGEAMGLSHKRVHILVREALRLEMDAALTPPPEVGHEHPASGEVADL